MIDRITILGGSSVYIPELLMSIITRNMRVREVVLHGRPGRKLELVTAFCKRLVRRSGFPMEIIGTSDTAQAVCDATYILNHVRVGGMAARIRDEMLPPKYGMLGDDCLGAGGFSSAIRTLPVVFEIAEAVEANNPNATFVNLANPIGIVVEGLVRHTNVRVVGLCDLPGAYVRKIAAILQQPLERLRVDYIGLNHLGWIQDVKVDGRSAMTRLLDVLESGDEDGFDQQLIALFRMIPTRNTGKFFRRADLAAAQRSSARFRAEVLHEAEAQILKLYEDKTLAEIPSLLRQRNAVWYEKTVLPMIEALESPTPQERILCVANDGYIRDLPGGASVEVPAEVSSHGIEPRKVGSVPRFVRGVYMAMKESDRLTVEAIRHHSYDLALQALTINPFVPSFEIARRYLDQVCKEERLTFH